MVKAASRTGATAELRVVPCRIVWCSRPAEDDSDYCIVHAARERAHG